MIYLAPRSSSYVEVMAAVTRAGFENRSLRIETGKNANGSWVKFKVGEGMWSPPLYSDEDPNVPVQHMTIVDSLTDQRSEQF